MSETLFKAKSIEEYRNGEWVEGYVFDDGYENGRMFVGSLEIQEYQGSACDKWDIVGTCFYEVDQDTICKFTEITDKNNVKIWENDIVKYDGDGYCSCIGVVKYGVWSQDASGGEYSGARCIGYYVELKEIIPYPYLDETADEILEYFPYYLKQYSLASLKDVEKIGNIFDNK